MSNLLILSFVIASLNCKTKVENSINDGGLNKVTIRFVNLSITTPVLVRCNDFDNYFEEDKIQHRTLNNRTEWNELLGQINALAATGEETDEMPDVRMTIKLHYRDRIRLICVGNLITSIDGASYLNHSSFNTFINSNFQE